MKGEQYLHDDELHGELLPPPALVARAQLQLAGRGRGAGVEVSHVAVPDAEHSSVQLGEWVHAKPRMLWWAGVHRQDLSPSGRAYGAALAAQLDRKGGLGVCEGVVRRGKTGAFQGDVAIFFFHRPLLRP